MFVTKGKFATTRNVNLPNFLIFRNETLVVGQSAPPALPLATPLCQSYVFKRLCPMPVGLSDFKWF